MVPNQVVATVNSVKGQAFARGPDGLRPLKPGDHIYDGETLVTGDGPVVLTSDVGNPFAVQGGTEVAMAPDDDEVEMTPKRLEETINELQLTLDDIEAPATGPSPSNEGHDTTPEIIRVNETIDPPLGTYPGGDPSLPSGRRSLRGSGGTGSGGGNGGPSTEPWQGTDDTFSVEEGETVRFENVLANDGAGDSAKVGQVVSPDGLLNINVNEGGTTVTTALGGTVTIYPDGHFDYTAPVLPHTAGAPDPVDSFQYRAVNSSNVSSDPITVKISVADTSPVAVDDDLGDTNYIARNTGNVITGEGGTNADVPSADGPDALHVVAVRAGEGGNAVDVTQSPNFGNGAPTLVTANGGRVWINPDGSFQYAAPATGYDGLDSFQYKLTDTDSESGWATVTVNVKELPPASFPDKFSVDEGSTTSFESVLAHDGGKATAVASVTGKDGAVELVNGSATITTALGGTVTIHADGTFDYTAPLPTHTAGAPDPVDSFVYVPVSAKGTLGGPATVNITVKDTVPVAVDDDLGETNYLWRNTGNVIEGELLTGAGADKPSADGPDALHVVAVRAGEGGNAVDVTQSPNFGNGAPTLVTANGGRVWINPDGSFQYAAPATGYDGLDSFQYKLTDTDSESDWATVTVNVKELPPASFSDNVSAAEGSTTSFESVLANDGGKATAVANVTGKDGAVELVNGSATIATALGGTVTVHADGTFDYKAPLRDHSDNVSDHDHFYYQPISDQGTLGGSTKVNITVTDTVPVANDDYIGDTSYIARNAGNVINGTGGASADVPSADGPDALHIAAVRAGEGGNAVTVVESSSLGNGAPALVTVNGGRVWINPDGSFQYAAPRTGYDGADSFQYQLTDTDGRSEWATVTFNVLELPPASRTDNFSIVEGTSGTFDVLANDGAKDTTTVGKVLDAENNEVDVVAGGVAIATALGGVVTIRPDGSFDYKAPLRDHSDDVSDHDHFSYRPVSDQGTLGSLTTVNIAITDTAPTANDGDSGQTNYIVRNWGNVITGAGLDTDSSGRLTSPDVEVSATHVAAIRAGDGGDVVDVAQSPSLGNGAPTLVTEHGGSVWINPDGTFQYLAPNDGYAGPDSFDYILVDDDGSTSDWATVTVDVKELPPAPLHGEEGEDVFAWTLSDVSDSPVNVSIAQFTAGEDKLDLRDLLADDAKEFQFDTEHLSVSVNDGSTKITVSPVDPDALALNIVVEGVDLTGGNAGQAAIDHMLNNGTLIDDK
ncbi:MAG: tandem-95 repeat protein [Azoarcus sp.]|jgi:hypothetical protein|nr:tandem-95 repeat protein [Azoarcus sp.]